MAIAEKVSALERAEIRAELREGYLARAREVDEAIQDWSALDTVDWPEYE